MPDKIALDHLTLTILPLGLVTLPIGATWGQVRGEVADLFRCTMPLEITRPGTRIRQPIAAPAVIGTPPLLPDTVLFVHPHRHSAQAKRSRRIPKAKFSAANNTKPNRSSVQFSKRFNSWGNWFGIAVSAVGSIVMALVMRQPTFALFGLFGVLGLLPNLVNREQTEANQLVPDKPLPKVVPLRKLLLADKGSAGKWAVPIGVNGDGAVVYFDLVADGPHLLIAGTTGAGKSVVLRSLVLALAAQLSPAEMAIALVDFKGGAGFGDCAELPHVIGQVTDLDTGLAERALSGLHLELIRRKQILHQFGVADILELPDGELPRLVVVFDEFRALTEELPDAIPQLFRIAAQGRSLGIHLVLATQRAAGAVSPEVRANVSARLALRVVDAADSLDLVDTALAADLPAVPGRAVMRLGAGVPQTMQCAWADAPLLPDVWRPDVPVAPIIAPSLITQIRENHQIPTTHPPLWLPPLPATIRLSELFTAPLGDSATPAKASAQNDEGAGKPATPAFGGYADGQGPAAQPSAQNDEGAGDSALTAHWAAPQNGAKGAPWLGSRDWGATTSSCGPIGSAGSREGHSQSEFIGFGVGDFLELGLQRVVGWLPGTGNLGLIGRDARARNAALTTIETAAIKAGRQVHRLAHPSSSELILEQLLSNKADKTIILVENAERWRDNYQAAQSLTQVAEQYPTVFCAGNASIAGYANAVTHKLILLSNDLNEDLLLGTPNKFAGKGCNPGRACWVDAASDTGPVLTQIATA